MSAFVFVSIRKCFSFRLKLLAQSCLGYCCTHLIVKLNISIIVYSSASAMRNTPLKLSYVYQCNGCDSFHLQPVGRTISKVFVVSKSLLYLHCTTGSSWIELLILSEWPRYVGNIV